MGIGFGSVMFEGNLKVGMESQKVGISGTVIFILNVFSSISRGKLGHISIRAQSQQNETEETERNGMQQNVFTFEKRNGIRNGTQQNVCRNKTGNYRR